MDKFQHYAAQKRLALAADKLPPVQAYAVTVQTALKAEGLEQQEDKDVKESVQSALESKHDRKPHILFLGTDRVIYMLEKDDGTYSEPLQRKYSVEDDDVSLESADKARKSKQTPTRPPEKRSAISGGRDPFGYKPRNKNTDRDHAGRKRK